MAAAAVATARAAAGGEPVLAADGAEHASVGKNYERVRDFSVAIVGIGGVGVSVCEMLTRCGVGKIILYDFDTIELANMNKMFYRPEQAGWNKTMACRHYCSPRAQPRRRRSRCTTSTSRRTTSGSR